MMKGVPATHGLMETDVKTYSVNLTIRSTRTRKTGEGR